MAKQVITKLLDDLDGSEADETLTFAVDGMGYEIDLSGRNAKAFRDFVGTYIEAGQRTGRVGPGAQLQRHRPTVEGSGRTGDRELNAAIREWAIGAGYELAERGRIPTYIQDAYSTRTPNPQRVRETQAALIEEETVKPATTARKAAPKKTTVPAVNFKPERVKT